MYKVTFDFLNAAGDWITTYLDNNGDGFTLEDAENIAYQLKQHKGNRNVNVEYMD